MTDPTDTQEFRDLMREHRLAASTDAGDTYNALRAHVRALLAPLEAEVESLRGDARRLNCMLAKLHERRINGEVTYYSLSHSLHFLRGCTNVTAMRAAIDAALHRAREEKERG